MVIHAGDHHRLHRLANAGSHEHATDDGDLPQRHRGVAFPPPALPRLAPRPASQQSVPDQDPVHRQSLGPISCTSRTDPHRGCAPVAAPRTYLRQTTQEALQRFAPEVPSKPIPNCAVPDALDRTATQLEFKATIAQEDLDPDLLADVDELDQ
jgi:hypothetical protein